MLSERFAFHTKTSPQKIFEPLINFKLQSTGNELWIKVKNIEIAGDLGVEGLAFDDAAHGAADGRSAFQLGGELNPWMQGFVIRNKTRVDQDGKFGAVIS
jgi:hypothetical protein